MPNIHIPTAAKDMPSFNRRTFLRGTGSAIAVAGAGVTPAVAAVGAPVVAAVGAPVAASENEELLWLGELLDDYLAERTAAETEIERITYEWRDRWPLAPEALLGPPLKGTASDSDMWQAERDIAGSVLERDVSTLHGRFSRKQVAELAGQRMAFYVQTSGSIEDTLTQWRNHKPTRRTPNALARSRAWRTRAIVEGQTRLYLARLYEADTAHNREVSGVDVAKARLAKAKENVASVREAISHAPAHSPVDLRKKAEVVRDELNESSLDWPSMFPGSGLGRLQRLAFAVADGGSYS